MTRFAAVLDFETTGLDETAGDVIEGAVALVELSPNGTFGETVKEFWSFNEPAQPISAEITKLTGITDEQVRGQRLDWEKFNSMLSEADVLISHNVRFDRAWLERHGRFKENKHWACSLNLIEWSRRHGMPCRTLKHLAWEHDFFPNAHRAIDDVKTLVQLLRMPSKGDSAKSYGQELLENVAIPRRLVFATGAPFEKKDTLRLNGFRWSGQRRVWWKLLAEPELPETVKFLASEVYLGISRHQLLDGPVDFLRPGFRADYMLD